MTTLIMIYLNLIKMMTSLEVDGSPKLKNSFNCFEPNSLIK